MFSQLQDFSNRDPQTQVQVTTSDVYIWEESHQRVDLGSRRWQRVLKGKAPVLMKVKRVTRDAQRRGLPTVMEAHLHTCVHVSVQSPSPPSTAFLGPCPGS